MPSARALANQKLYYARLLAQSWRQALDSERIPAQVLAGAFNDAARDHLRAAYGWFLLEIAQPAVLPGVPPIDSTQLPDLIPGKAMPGEVRELQQLEQGGWIEQILRPSEVGQNTVKMPGSLAISVEETPHPDAIDRWIAQFEALFDRMSDSLDEY